jgi:predicted MFS family arabinose efflux permease
MNTTDTVPTRRTLTPAEWGLVALLAAVNFTHILDFVIVMPLGERLMNELGITPTQFGYVVSVYGVAAAVAGVMAASVVDRFDRKASLLVAYAGFTAATLLCGLAPTYGWLLAARGLAGAFGGVAASLIMTVIGDVFPDHRRGKAIGAVQSAFAVASVIGLPTGLMLAKWLGRGAPFFAIAALSVVVFAVALARLPSLTKHRATGRAKPFEQFAAVLSRPAHWRSFAFTLTLVLGTFTIIPFLAPYLQINCGRSDTDVPIVYAVAGLCTLVGMNVIGWLADRFGKRPVFLALAVGSMAMTVVVTNLPPVGLIAATAAATGFMLTAAGRVVPAQAMMLWSADLKLRGAFTNMNSAVSHLATGLAPMIAGRIINRDGDNGPLVGYDLAGFVAVGFATIALGISFLLKPQPAAIPLPAPAPSPA